MNLGGHDAYAAIGYDNDPLTGCRLRVERPTSSFPLTREDYNLKLEAAIFSDNFKFLD